MILLYISLINNNVIIILISKFNKYLYKYIRSIKVILYSILNEISLSFTFKFDAKLILRIIYF